LVDALLESDDSDEETYAWDAMRMLDYQDEVKPFRTKPIAGRRHNVNREMIQKALKESESNTDELIYVRECFDELYFRLGICRTYPLKENTKLFEQKTASRF
jgi:hypothetical protein